MASTSSSTPSSSSHPNTTIIKGEFVTIKDEPDVVVKDEPHEEDEEDEEEDMEVLKNFHEHDPSLSDISLHVGVRLYTLFCATKDE